MWERKRGKGERDAGGCRVPPASWGVDVRQAEAEWGRETRAEREADAD